MPRTRYIKPGLFKNETLAECDLPARYLFPALWTLADREGRLEDRPKRIKAEGYPYDNYDVDDLLQQLADQGFIIRYEVDGARYIQIVTFTKHQRPHAHEPKSSIPPPPGFPAHTGTNDVAASTDNVATRTDISATSTPLTGNGERGTEDSNGELRTLTGNGEPARAAPSVAPQLNDGLSPLERDDLKAIMSIVPGKWTDEGQALIVGLIHDLPPSTGFGQECRKLVAHRAAKGKPIQDPALAVNDWIRGAKFGLAQKPPVPLGEIDYDHFPEGFDPQPEPWEGICIKLLRTHGRAAFENNHLNDAMAVVDLPTKIVRLDFRREDERQWAERWAGQINHAKDEAGYAEWAIEYVLQQLQQVAS